MPNEEITALPPVETPENLLAEMIALRDEAKRFRDEARTMLAAARSAAGLTFLPEVSRNWVTAGIPALPDACPADRTRYEAGEGAYLVCRDHSGKADYDAYLARLAEAGFACHAEFVRGALTVSTWYNADAVLTVSFAESDGILRAVVEPMAETTLPPTETMCYGDVGTALPLLVQENRLYEEVNCGMSYIFRLRDGSFFLIDGGWDTPEIADRLYETLVRLADGRRPEIAAWVFTHAHVDHVGAFFRFAEKYTDAVTLHRVIYSFPGKVRITEAGAERAQLFALDMRNAIARFGAQTKICKARTGQRFSFCGLTMEILFSFEDYPQPHPLRHFNETSLVLSITTEGQRFMFLGDAYPTGCEILCARYGDLLRSDVVQVAHHGYHGATKEVYDAIAAPFVLWPCPSADPTGKLRYADPEWSPITREMVRTYASQVWCTADGYAELPLPLKADHD